MVDEAVANDDKYRTGCNEEDDEQEQLNGIRPTPPNTVGDDKKAARRLRQGRPIAVAIKETESERKRKKVRLFSFQLVGKRFCRIYMIGNECCGQYHTKKKTSLHNDGMWDENYVHSTYEPKNPSHH